MHNLIDCIIDRCCRSVCVGAIPTSFTFVTFEVVSSSAAAATYALIPVSVAGETCEAVLASAAFEAIWAVNVLPAHSSPCEVTPALEFCEPVLYIY